MNIYTAFSNEGKRDHMVCEVFKLFSHGHTSQLACISIGEEVFSDLKHYMWEDPYLFIICYDQIVRKCVSQREGQDILKQCYASPTGGHYSTNYTTKKILDAGFY